MDLLLYLRVLNQVLNSTSIIYLKSSQTFFKDFFDSNVCKFLPFHILTAFGGVSVPDFGILVGV